MIRIYKNSPTWEAGYVQLQWVSKKYLRVNSYVKWWSLPYKIPATMLRKDFKKWYFYPKELENI